MWFSRRQAAAVHSTVSMSGGKFITSGVSIAIGKYDKAIHPPSRANYIEPLKYVTRKHVIPYDQVCRRA